jgi:hypothetical protein
MQVLDTLEREEIVLAGMPSDERLKLVRDRALKLAPRTTVSSRTLRMAESIRRQSSPNK